MYLLHLLQDQVRILAWIGNLTHLYLTSLCRAVNYHISDTDYSLEQRGADRHILCVTEWNVSDGFGKFEFRLKDTLLGDCREKQKFIDK